MVHQLIRSGPQVPFFDGGWASTAVAVWDVAAAHLLMEDALRERPQEVRADPFLVTGKCEPWSYAKMRNTLKVRDSFSRLKVACSQISMQILCEPPLELVALPPLAMLLTAHAVEIMLWTRYHSLATVFAILRMKHKPALVPKWLGQTRNLQPAMMTYMREFILDDSRARKVLGYVSLCFYVLFPRHSPHLLGTDLNGLLQRSYTKLSLSIDCKEELHCRA